MRSETTVILVTWDVWKGSIYINVDLQFKCSIYFSRWFFQIRRRNSNTWIVAVCLICAVNIDTERSRSHTWLRSRVWIAGTASRQYEACVQDGVWTGCRLQR